MVHGIGMADPTVISFCFWGLLKNRANQHLSSVPAFHQISALVILYAAVLRLGEKSTGLLTIQMGFILHVMAGNILTVEKQITVHVVVYFFDVSVTNGRGWESGHILLCNQRTSTVWMCFLARLSRNLMGKTAAVYELNCIFSHLPEVEAQISLETPPFLIGQSVAYTLSNLCTCSFTRYKAKNLMVQ